MPVSVTELDWGRMQMRHFPVGRSDGGASVLLLLALTAISMSRLVFALIGDAEGPNLVVVLGLGLLIWSVSLIAYVPRFLRSTTGLKRTAYLIPVQLVLAVTAYLLLR